jgi:mycothiol synthase
LREVAAEHPANLPKAFQAGGLESEDHSLRVLEAEGYTPVRGGHLIIRQLAEPIPAHPLPSGLDVRPVENSQILPIWRAAEEAFRDHWGHGEWKDEYLAEWREAPTFQPHLWQVAWDGTRSQTWF